MASCRKIESLIAASVYDDVTNAERVLLAAHLEGCAACRDEQASLISLVQSIPSEEVAFEGDLRPALLEEIRRSGVPAGGRKFSWRLAHFVVPAAAALAVVFGIDQFSGREAAMPPAVAPVVSPLVASIESSDRLAASDDYSGAYLALSEGLEAYPDASSDPEAAYALQRMGEIAFGELRWYPQAHEALLTLRAEHFSEFRADGDNILRLEILSDAKGPEGDFAALHDLDRARNVDEFEAYERVASRYAGTSIASLAAMDMARAAGDDVSPDALDAALAQCTDPVAADQVRLELAMQLRGDASALARSDALLREVVENGHGLLARRAQSSLDGSR